jgi:L-2-hydroxyglutarate oxidase LhgO
MARGSADADVVVVGAGVVGLAVAAALARSGRSVLVLERDEGIARGITSRNSEIIHAGIYYPHGSLKAQCCTRGRELLYPRCAERGVPHRKTGKLIVAGRAEEVATLEELKGRAEANGVPGMRMLEGREVHALEPALEVFAGLLSPETGIVDAHALSLSYLAEAEEHGATLLPHHEVVALEPSTVGWRVEAMVAGQGVQSVECEWVVNAAGLGGDRIAALAGLEVESLGYRLHLCKGDYFSLAPASGISLQHLIYPVPVAAGLGTHATLDLGGRVRFGPDTEYVDVERYDVAPNKAAQFGEAVRRYLPKVSDEWLTPDYSGIRPKLAGPGEGFRDFVICEETANGAPGLVSCIGIESPGLTAAGAIAERVVALL